MVRIASESVSVKPEWHVSFLRMLPAIVTHARIAFRHLDPEAREEAVQEVVCNACRAVARLAELGKTRPCLPERLGTLRCKPSERWSQGRMPP